MRVLPIPDFPNYFITDTGEVRDKFGIKLSTWVGSGNNYERITLRNCHGKKTLLIHRLVAQSFVPNEDNLPEVDHKDNNRSHNHYTNLQWIAHNDNLVKAHAKHITICNPQGLPVIVYNLREFCRIHNLSHNRLYKIATGRMQGHCEGYTKWL